MAFFAQILKQNAPSLRSTTLYPHKSLNHFLMSHFSCRPHNHEMSFLFASELPPRLNIRYIRYTFANVRKTYPLREMGRGNWNKENEMFPIFQKKKWKRVSFFKIHYSLLKNVKAFSIISHTRLDSRVWSVKACMLLKRERFDSLFD